MLFVVTGSSCSGKSTAAAACAGLPSLSVHDQDEDGVPDGAGIVWRQQSIERWVQRAAEVGRHSEDLLLTTQSPLGEVLAAPSAETLDGLAVCLMYVEDRERWIRLERRDPGKWNRDQKRSFIGWARWHRAHADDPRAHPEVIIDGGWPAMQWERWADWASNDVRWHVDRIDTTYIDIDQSAAAVRDWVLRARAALRDGTLPLRKGW